MNRTAAPDRRRPPRWYLSVPAGLGLALLVASGLIAWSALHAQPSTTPAAEGPPRVTRNERRAVAVAYVDVEGGVTPLYPLKSGQVAEVPAAEGKAVEKGAPLIRLVDTLEKLQLAEASLDLKAAEERQKQAGVLVEQHRRQLAAQKAAVQVAQSDVKAAESQQAKARRLYESNVGASAEEVAGAGALVEKARAAVKAEQAKLRVLEATDPEAAVRLAQIDVDAKRDQVKKAEYNLSLCTVTAPEKGTILRCLVSPGETLGPTPRQPALYFCADRPRVVRAEVEQEFANRVTLGQVAVIQDDATGGGDWRGTVTRVSDWYTQRRSIMLEPMQFNDIRTLECILRVEPDAKNPLRIGQRVRVTLAAPN